jgi:hypothetical protein
LALVQPVAAGARGRTDLPLAAWPIERPTNWIDLVNVPQTEAELAALRRSLARGRPFGSEAWEMETAQRLALAYTLRSRGRPKKTRDGTDEAKASPDQPPGAVSPRAAVGLGS